MSEKTTSGVHWSFWVIAAIAVIWNGLGSVNYLVQVYADSLDAYREVEQAIIAGRPVWATAGFAIGVFGGTVGGLLLLIRHAIASHMFIASLVGVIVATVHTLGVDADFGIGELIVIAFMPVIVAALFLWYAKHAEGKGWIS